MRVQVVSVNHRMTEYLELMLLSLLAHHRIDDNTKILVLDNGSGDLEKLNWTKDHPIEIQQSGYSIGMPVDTHGEVLRKAVVENPDCDAYLFVDPDACFIEDDTIQKMWAELVADEELYAVQAAWSTNGRDVVNPPINDHAIHLKLLVRHSEEAEWMQYAECVAEQGERVHTFCLLLRNDETVRRVVQAVGFSPAGTATYRSNIWWDTAGLFNEIMKTHGRRWRLSEHKVIHLSDACLGDGATTDQKEQRNLLLSRYRDQVGANAGDGRSIPG